MINRNSKKLPKEDILAIKKTGKRLRNGYALTKLKKWKKDYAERKKKSVTSEENKPKFAMKTDRLKRAKVTIARRKKSKAMEERRAYWKAKSGGIKKVGEKVEEKKQISPKRAMPSKQAISKAKSGGIKKVGEKVGEKKQISPESSIIKTENETSALPVVETKPISKISEIAKESKGKIVVASLPKFTEEKSETKKIQNKVLQNQKGNSNLLTALIYGFNNELISLEEQVKLRDWVDNNDDFTNEPNKNLKLDIEDIVNTYALTGKYDIDYEQTNKYIRILICWYLYNDIANAPKKINNLFKHINKKDDIDIIPIPIYADSKNKNIIKPIKNINWKTFWTLTKNLRSDDEDRPVMKNVYYDNTDLVVTDSYKLLVVDKNVLNDETQKKLQKQTVYNENLNTVNENYPNYIKVIPNEDNVFIQNLVVQDEINKCKLLLKLKKYFFDSQILKTITKVLYEKNDGFYCFSYNAKYMLDILEFYEKLGVSEVEILVQNNYGEELGNSSAAIINDKSFHFTKKAVIIKPIKSDIYSFSLLMPIVSNALLFFDVDSIDLAEKLYKDNGLQDNLDMSSEVEEIANDVPAFGDLFSDMDMSSEVEEIANDVPAFGDDISEEKIILDTEYDLPEVQLKRDDTAIASSKDIRAMKFKQIMLPSKYKALLGKVPENFRLLLWGAPGHGKSSLALTIANDIGKRVKTLYVSAEESLESATLSSRIKRFKANSRNLMFNYTNNPEIIEKIIMTFNPKFIVIDSVNVILGKTEAIINLMLKYPNIGFIIIAQATKDRKRYAGLGSLAHAVDIVVNVKDGLATAEKNRYAQLGSMVVKGIKI